MNERIRLLAKQAGYTPDMFGVGHWDMPECKKFAELIVRECMRVADSHGKGWAHLNGTEGNRIRQHFGIPPE